MTQKTNSTEEVTPAEIRAKAQIDLLTEQINRDQAKVSLLQSAIKDIHTSREVENRPDPLSKDLEALEGWKRAASGKCEYLRNAPLGLVEKVRSTKGGVKGQWHHFTADNDRPTLFRFKRGTK